MQAAYRSDPGKLTALFLIGHIPVPYAGDVDPDGHPNHQGAWPADVYYADVDGNWTDTDVNTTTAERDVNWNVPGDGKFDQAQPPATLKLQMGRVDLSNMTCFANKTPSRSEVDLMRQYFQKDHGFRHRLFTADRRGIMCDNFADKGKDPIAGSAYRSFSTFFGQGQTDFAPWDGYFPAATSKSYLWSFASGGGSYYYSMGVGTSDDFAVKDIKAVFTMWMGSYFGDWNNESNFLRAPLGSGNVLTASYSGFPSTWYFPMGLGETIGYCILQSQNNNTNGLFAPWDQGSHQVHIDLMGDPTLRLLPVIPPSNLNAATQPGKVNLSWGASGDENIAGYHVYRAVSAAGPFTRVTGDAPVGATQYSDVPPAGSYTYMVRAVKLEQTASGSYYNPSQGIFATATVSGSTPQPPATPTDLRATAISSSRIDLQWTDVANETGFKLERKKGANGSWGEITTISAGGTGFNDTGLTASTQYYYRIRAFNTAGLSPYSAEAQATTPAQAAPSASAKFIGIDAATQGDWPAKYGAEGYVIAGGDAHPASYAQVSLGGKSDFVWETNTSDPRALRASPTDPSGIAATWYADSLSIDLSITGSAAHRVSFYVLDWDGAGRAEHFEIIDIGTGTTLDAHDLAQFQNGIYVVYDLLGAVQIRLSKTAGPNAVLNGVFFGGPVGSPISNKPLTLSLASKAGNQFTLRISGDSGQKYTLQSSSDFHNWTGVSTGALSGQTGNVTVTINPNARFTCFRTINTP